MFRVGQVDEHPIRIHPRLLERASEDGLFPILIERTPVRLDLTHSAWSDIFFLGMDYPEGARVLNISVERTGMFARPPRICGMSKALRPNIMPMMTTPKIGTSNVGWSSSGERG